jgi:hypothetical protein
MSAAPSTAVAAAAAPASTPQWVVDAQGAIGLLSQGYAALLPILDAVLKTNLPGSPEGAKTGSSATVGASVGVSVTTDVGAVASAVGAVATASGKIADALTAHEKIINSPAMQNASEDAKWQAFVNLINRSEQQGDAKTQEKLQA